MSKPQPLLVIKMKRNLFTYLLLPPIFILFVSLLILPTTSVGQNADAKEYDSVEERRLQGQLNNNAPVSNTDIDNILRRQNDLKILEETVDRKLAEVEKKIAELKKTKSAIQALLAQKDAVELSRLKQLAKIYEQMATDKAARAIAGLDRELATDLLTRMKTKSVASILATMPQSVAIDLTTRVSATQLE